MKKTKNLFAVILGLFLLNSCATHSYLDTAKFRSSEFNSEKINLMGNGLSQEEISIISGTKMPTVFPVDITFIIMKDGFINPKLEQLFLKNIVSNLKENQKIGRIVPIPRFLIPNQINFSKLQELGIRSLSEYVILFDMNSSTLFSWEKILETKIEITSSIDFIVIDSKTTAIVGADKLHSTIEYNVKLFDDKNMIDAQKNIFSEQGKLLAEIINNLFKN